MSGGEIRFGKRSDWDKISDQVFVSLIAWNDPVLKNAAQSGVVQFWRAWSQANAARGDRRRRKKRMEGSTTKWPWSESRAHPATKVWSLIDKQDWQGLSRWATKQPGAVVEAWCDERTESELLVLADWLWNGPRVDVAVGFPIWRLVLTRALELSAYLAEPLTCELTADRRLMVTGELPWLLGQLFCEIDGVTEFRQLGQQSLRNELIELTDGDGTPSASLLPQLAHWLSSLIRSVDVGAIVGEPLLEGESKFRFEDLVTKAVLLLDRDGRMLTSDLVEESLRKGEVAAAVSLLSCGAELASLDELSLAAESLRYRRHVAKHGSTKEFRSETFATGPEERLIVTDTDLPATQSDWAGWACLRNWWQPTANTVVLISDSSDVQLHISLLGVPVISGDWGLKVTLDNKKLTWSQSWKCTCWVSDTDMDYIELQIELPDGPMICRQVCLSRKDQFLVLADSVSRAGGRRIDLTSSLPLCRGVRSKSATDTREQRLMIGDVVARCYPLGLPDDRALSTVGNFECERDMRTEPPALRLTQAASHESLYAPIVIDWNPDRSRLAAEWRTLTVTEDGHKLAPWQATGHRVRVGNLHLIVYRSLAPSEETRAVLGLHTDQESVIAQFHEKGYVLPIVAVDA